MRIITYTVGPFAENTYLLVENNQAILIDPGFHKKEEFDSFTTGLEEEDATLIATVLTHAHVDHILGLDKVCNSFDIPIYLNDRDRTLWNNYPSQAEMFGFKVDALDIKPIALREQKNWKIGPFEFDVYHTPGHSPDHIILYSEKDNAVIAGDTLFRRGIGRTDLYKGDFKQLEKSITEYLYTLPDDTIVYPGHGPETTIGYEKKENPFVRST